ncbi:hypothetical protein N5C16_13475 [Stenotrophomonas sp. GD03908]|uniref:Uncharacterized protein n=1 Tax=Stenotrophomonas maltophilia TaxID=40324 RepID=A0AAJ2WLG4_STEMA|nr:MULTISPECIES: hypothetical protein [Stenotrophomonas]MBH1484198.1 hypothetical protein [Stenotrophomonas maltophilia]MDH0980282.1 hypothetical protein [Stenotrophomonas sp. GD03908]MDQ7293344.1 hypothetical protein [Stenotrophomonas sp. Sm0041]MDZ5765133.1 hypothetical protein [Stenotrophomonas maltophilia]
MRQALAGIVAQLLVIARPIGIYGKRADAVQVQGKKAAPTGKRKHHRSNVIASPCHPPSLVIHDSHATQVIPMRDVSDFED